MLNTLRFRSILSHTLTLFVLIPLTALVLSYVIESRVLVPDIARELREQAQLVVLLARQQPTVWDDSGQAQALVRTINPGVSAVVMLLNGNGRILATSDPHDADHIGTPFRHPGLQAILAGQMSQHTDYSRQLDGQVADVFLPVTGANGQVVGVVRMAHLLSTVYDQFLGVRYSIAIILGFALILGTVSALGLSAALERPLRKLANSISGFASGHELLPLPVEGPKEIRQVAQAFNLLLDQMRYLEQSRRQLLANTVHELSTPLGALKSGVQAMQEGADEEPDLRREFLQGMAGEISRLEQLLRNLTGLYDQTAGPIRLNRQSMDLAELLNRVLPMWREAAIRKDLQWSEEIAADLPSIQADPDRLAQIISNLLNNAIKYTYKGGSVRAAAGSEGKQVWFSVTDTGSGIADDELQQIFLPFFRGRGAGRFAEGMGLGLPIARQLAEAHGGRLEVESSPGKGSTFTLWLPAH